MKQMSQKQMLKQFWQCRQELDQKNLHISFSHTGAEIVLLCILTFHPVPAPSLSSPSSLSYSSSSQISPSFSHYARLMIYDQQPCSYAPVVLRQKERIVFHLSAWRLYKHRHTQLQCTHIKTHKTLCACIHRAATNTHIISKFLHRHGNIWVRRLKKLCLTVCL